MPTRVFESEPKTPSIPGFTVICVPPREKGASGAKLEAVEREMDLITNAV